MEGAATTADLAQGVPVALARLEYVRSVNTPNDVILGQIAANLARGLPEVELREEAPSEMRSVSICGSAPSLAQTHTETAGPIMAGNAAIRTLLSYGRTVDYGVIWDASPEMMRHVCEGPRAWLVASRVNPAVIDRLIAMGQSVKLWHVAGDDGTEDVLSGRPTVPGGAQFVTRAVYLAALMGFYDQHLFGADSSFATETHLGGSVRDESAILLQVADRLFRTTVWMANQADDWQNLILPHLAHAGVRITFHGDGLLPYVHDLWMRNNLGAA